MKIKILVLFMKCQLSEYFLKNIIYGLQWKFKGNNIGKDSSPCEREKARNTKAQTIPYHMYCTAEISTQEVLLYVIWEKDDIKIKSPFSIG